MTLKAATFNAVCLDAVPAPDEDGDIDYGPAMVDLENETARCRPGSALAT